MRGTTYFFIGAVGLLFALVNGGGPVGDFLNASFRTNLVGYIVLVPFWLVLFGMIAVVFLSAGLSS